MADEKTPEQIAADEAAAAKLARFLPQPLPDSAQSTLLPDGRSITCDWYANQGADLGTGAGLNWAVQVCVVDPGGPSG